MAFASVVFNMAKDKVQNMVKGVAYLATHEVVVGAEGEHSDLLYLHEKGVPSRNIPPRPVLEPAMAQREVRKQMRSQMTKAMADAVVHGDLNATKSDLERAGEIGRDACKKYITDGTHLAPNAPATIARKGSDIPLIETGKLLQSITYEVRRK